ncbi:MAG: hypothetical protein J0M12_13245 [Deltaproteobacteria bacterium]|nr:hypothetical protein [Deltaproteobacteria bacterium]
MTASLSKATLLIALALTLCCCQRFGFRAFGDYAYLEKAEEYSRQNEPDKAIDAYRKHMRYRLSLNDRPKWENPYLYLLMIGDLQLTQNKPTDALETYKLAELNKVDPALVSDRYRYLASWYESKDDLDAALKILTTYRDRDPLLFDVMRDRMAKELVKKEDAPATPTATPATPTATATSVPRP